MNDKNFRDKVDRLIEEIDSAAVANGEELSWLEIIRGLRKNVQRTGSTL